MRKLIALIGAIVLVIGLYSIAPIEEDSAAWNCLIHGNMRCGEAPHLLGFILP